MSSGSTPLLPLGIVDFWERVKRAKRRFLGLDYDGTLAPFKIERDAAYPLPGVVDSLKQIKADKNTTLAVVSGRPVKEILHFLGNLGIIIIGGHGAEILYPDKELSVFSLTEEQRSILGQAALMAERRGLTGRIEKKATSVALHTRGMGEAEAEQIVTEVRADWAAVAADADLECHDFNGGVELRLTAVDKGKALRRILKEQPSETFAVYVGDDKTDEDAFAATIKLGAGIKVTQTDEPTLAQGRLADCWAVLTFLRQWGEITE